MKNKRLIILSALILIVGITSAYFIFKKRSNTLVLADQSLGLCVSEVLWNDFRSRIKNLTNLNTSKGETCPNQLSLKNEISGDEQVIYEKRLNLSPEDLGKFFQGKIEGDVIYIVLDQEVFNESLASDLKKEYKQNPPKSASLVAGGDVSLARYNDYMIEKKGADYCFSEIKSLFLNSDIGFVNLESPFGLGKTNHDRNSMVFSAEVENAPILKNAGINLVNLANNHFGNQGQTGMKLTFETLAKQNIAYFGAGLNDNEAREATIKEIRGLKIAFLGYTDNDVLASSDKAGANRAGVNDMASADLNQDIAMAKSNADIVVVSMHSGAEYTPYANRRQINFAHKAIDSGADLVIWHHPHVVQGIENYKGKFIIYSLGNLVFDQPWSEETKQGLLLKTEFLFGKVVSLGLEPIYIQDFCQPSSASSDLTGKILQRIFSASEKLR